MNKKDRLTRIEYFLDIDHIDGWPNTRIDSKTQGIISAEIYKNNKYFQGALDEIRTRLNALDEYLKIELIPKETKTKPARYRKQK